MEAGQAATWLPVILGGGALLYSLLTNYELGAVRVLPMPVHLALDFMSGLLLASSPWLFGFHHVVHTPFVLLGLLEIGAALLTSTRSFARSAAGGSRLP